MTPKSILISLIGLVVVVGGLAILVMVVFLQPVTQTTQTQTDTGNYFGGSNTSVTTNGGGSQTSTEPFPEVDKAYATLFGQLLAQRLVFVAAQASSSGQLGSLYALYVADVDIAKKIFPMAKDFSIDVGFVDLTNDGTVEALVSVTLPGCGSAGCALDVYKKDKDKWVPIFGTIAGSVVGLSNTLTNGYLDLFLTLHGDVGYQTNVVRYVWDGTQYQPKETMATWDGTTFVLAR